MNINVKINGSEKQVKWATDIINGPATHIAGLIEIEERVNHNPDLYRELLSKYVAWVEAGAQAMGGALDAGWVIRNQGAFAKTANQMQKQMLQASGSNFAGYEIH